MLEKKIIKYNDYLVEKEGLSDKINITDD